MLHMYLIYFLAIGLGLTLLQVFAEMAPDAASRVIDTFFGYYLLPTLIVWAGYRFYKTFLSAKPDEHIDSLGFVQLSTTADRFTSRVNRHLATLEAIVQQQGSKRSARWAAVFPFFSGAYKQAQANRNVDKAYPFNSESVIAPIVHKNTGEITTEYSQHLANYLETAGKALGIDYQVLTPGTWHPTFSKKALAQADSNFAKYGLATSTLSRNIIISPGSRRWHQIAAQVLAITDYIQQKERSREEALTRIDLVLRSNIFQVEDKNLTPEDAYEWARAELYDSSAVSVAYPNGYSAATAPADQEDAR